MQKPTVAKVNPDLECSVCSRHLQHFIKTVLRNVLTSHSNKFQSINVFVDCVRSQLHAQLKPGHSHNAKQWSRHRHKLTSDNQWLSSSAFMLINVTFQSLKWIIGGGGITNFLYCVCWNNYTIWSLSLVSLPVFGFGCQWLTQWWPVLKEMTI